MLTLCVGNVKVLFDCDGGRSFNKNGMNDWVGRPVRVLGDPYRFNFDLEGRIQRMDGFPSPHSWDWLQRTMANDWLYYDKVWAYGYLPQPSSVIGDSVWAVNGRTDLPMLDGHDGLQREYVLRAFDAFDALISDIREWVCQRPPVYDESGREVASPQAEKRLWDFFERAARNDGVELQKSADRLHEIHGGMAVLPPDTIHADYRVILVKIMDGCSNACGFCLARGESVFGLRSQSDIDRQIDALAEVYGSDLYNYNSVVLGECDAFVSPLLEYAAGRAFELFHCGASHHAGSSLFLFSRNSSFCEASESRIELLESLPFERVYINIGWEAVEDAALSELGKQQRAGEVLRGMEKAGSINRKRGKVRISGNFISSERFNSDAIVKALRETRYCGRLYLSPLHGECSSRKALNDLHAIRGAHRDVMVYLYTMQRM
jgi:hypothetical protein